MAEHMRAKLVNDALLMAIWKHKPSKGLVWHTDRGSQEIISNLHFRLITFKNINVVRPLFRCVPYFAACFIRFLAW